MKLLLDENLSRKLVSRLADLYPEMAHVADVGLISSSDHRIWEFARAQSSVIVSADSDFYELATTKGPPPKVVWLRRWVHSMKDAEHVLRRDAVRIAAFASDPELGVLILDRD